jgi:hypothetical protein
VRVTSEVPTTTTRYGAGLGVRGLLTALDGQSTYGKLTVIRSLHVSCSLCAHQVPGEQHATVGNRTICVRGMDRLH